MGTANVHPMRAALPDEKFGALPPTDREERKPFALKYPVFLALGVLLSPTPVLTSTAPVLPPGTGFVHRYMSL